MNRLTKKNYKKGSVLILAYTVMTILLIIGTGYLNRVTSELTNARLYYNREKALWAAEAGLTEAYKEITSQYSSCSAALDNWQDITDSETGYDVTIYSQDGVTISSTGESGTTSQTVTGNLACIPSPFQNTISLGGNLNLNAALAVIHVDGKTRYSGNYNENSFWTVADFEDKQQEPDTTKTTLTLPDYNDNGVYDEFEDFLAYGQDVAGSYPENEVVYIQTDDTVNIFPHQNLIGKKVVYVEGSSPGTGDVNIYLDGTWQDGEDLTVISTGKIHYIEPLQVSRNSRLSTASWEGYKESSVFVGYHESVIYTEGNTEFEDCLDIGYFTGNVISDGNATLSELFTLDYWDFSDRAMNGDTPPGFAKFANGQISTQLTNWEIE